jgi:hypothetical protein
MKYAVATPTRGLLHSRTIEAVIANIEASDHEFCGWFLSHDLPIPDAHERVCEIALASGAEAIWMVEEDMVPPPGALRASLDLPGDIVALDYPAARDLSSIARRNGKIEWCFLGCTLIRRYVFDRLTRPWFSTHMTYRLVNGDLRPFLDERPPESRHGQQDIYFTYAAVSAGFRIAEVPGMVCGHAAVDRLGQYGMNEGWHTIHVRTRILGQQL